jgi:hypothetical protein
MLRPLLRSEIGGRSALWAPAPPLLVCCSLIAEHAVDRHPLQHRPPGEAAAVTRCPPGSLQHLIHALKALRVDFPLAVIPAPAVFPRCHPQARSPTAARGTAATVARARSWSSTAAPCGQRAGTQPCSPPAPPPTGSRAARWPRT